MPILQRSLQSNSYGLPSHSFSRAKKEVTLVFFLLGSLLLLVSLSLSLGSSPIPLKELIFILTGDSPLTSGYRIVRYVRLPRTVAALLGGLALALSGAILQTVLHNPLAGPSIIGVSSGAGFFSLLSSLCFPHLIALSSLVAFLGALGTTLLVYALAQRCGSAKLSIILAGVALSSLLGAMTDTLVTLKPEAQMGRLDFLIGSFAHVPFVQIIQTGPLIMGATIITLLLRQELTILGLGDEVAHSLGLEVSRTRFYALILASLLSGSAISMCGLVGFVGLVVPHLVRTLVGEDSPAFLALVALGGALLTLGCDLLARTLFTPYELPVGIVLSFLGSPFFLFLLFTQKKRRLYA